MALTDQGIATRGTRMPGARWPQALVAATLGLLVVVVLAACEPVEPEPGGAIVPPLATDGADIVDATGATVVLAGVNWFGFETDTNVVHGLWARDYRDMLAQIADLGYNTIRLPYSVQSLRDDSINSVNHSLGANAELQGLTPLEAMDRVIAAAHDEGLLVLLDSHRLDDQRIPELWYGDGFSEADWIDTWVLLAERYRDQPNVIGADLKNEPHGPATWGTGDLATDWRLAAERAGDAVLAVAPHWLIVVEGIGGTVAGQQLSGHWWGGNLEAAGTHPVRLSVPDRLVYSPHEYGPGVHDQPWFAAPDLEATLAHRWQVGFGYLVDEGIAPVLVGEFGGRSVSLDTVEGRWQQQFVDYLGDKGLSFTYWSWNPNSTDTGGILTDDWHTVHADKQTMLDRLLSPPGPDDGEPPTETTTTTVPPTVSTPVTSTTTTTVPSTSVPSGSGSVQVTFRVDSDWDAGYCGHVGVTNTTSGAISVTAVAFELQAATMASSWNGSVEVTGTTHHVTLPSWAHTVGAGETREAFGLCADRSGATTGAWPSDLRVGTVD